MRLHKCAHSRALLHNTRLASQHRVETFVSDCARRPSALHSGAVTALRASLSLSLSLSLWNSSMAPVSRNGKREEDYYGIKGDRKTRKPLVEKKRRARINESLQELRLLLTDSDAQTKMENAEVLEMTVKHVERILQNRAKADSMNREASERFAAGYIQCMHEVHTFVSSCPGIDATIAADLLNHLLECMPLNDEDRLQDLLSDLMGDCGNGGVWPAEGMDTVLSPREGSATARPSDLSLSPSSTSTEDLTSDTDETDTDHSHVDTRDSQDNLPTVFSSKSVWRPW
ncbi:transcription cofactor HES-6 isoform X2 [Neoarius graeffei]|uniref:transcription cofactor HES-6 isoform X2 n=1 Tax=Neoarius graeffei TaxID=443677 RepID=UPI00298C464E|nr:transcription cofactor HES-6 isoform X2 [Neoarius graeffei]